MAIDYLNGLIRRLNAHGSGVWTTQDELAFIMGLGTHGNGSAYQPQIEQGHIPNRRFLLQNYLRSIEHRKVWGEVDPTACIELTVSLLASGLNDED